MDKALYFISSKEASYLTKLAIKDKVSPTTQNQAFSAILFLYKEVLSVDMSEWNIQALNDLYSCSFRNE